MEDEASDAMLFRRALKKVGMEQSLVLVGDGDEAVQYLDGQGAFADRQKYPPASMVVLDLKLPRRSGFEVLDWLRSRQDSLRHLPVMVLSSSNLSRDVMAAYEKGANSYVAKPYSSEEYARMAAAFNSFWMRFNEQASCPRMLA